MSLRINPAFANLNRLRPEWLTISEDITVAA
jgi:hypothetical protein